MALMSSFVMIMALLISATVVSPHASAATEVAATSKTKKSGSEQIAELKNIVKGRLRIGASVNTASKMEGLSFKNNGATGATGEANTENTPALELTWVNRLYEGPDASKFDWFAGLTLERERTISSLNLKNAGAPAQTLTIRDGSRPTFHANLLSAGVRWTPNSTLYVPIGFNYGIRPAANGSKDVNFNLDPTVGIMAGAGLHLNSQFEVEAIYKIVRYDFSMRSTDPADKEELAGLVNLSGVSVAGRYIF